MKNAVDRTFADIRDHFGGLDVLVNNAGITRDALMIKVKDGELVFTDEPGILERGN